MLLNKNILRKYSSLPERIQRGIDPASLMVRLQKSSHYKNKFEDSSKRQRKEGRKKKWKKGERERGEGMKK